MLNMKNLSNLFKLILCKYVIYSNRTFHMHTHWMRRYSFCICERERKKGFHLRECVATKNGKSEEKCGKKVFLRFLESGRDWYECIVIFLVLVSDSTVIIYFRFFSLSRSACQRQRVTALHFVQRFPFLWMRGKYDRNKMKRMWCANKKSTVKMSNM